MPLAGDQSVHRGFPLRNGPDTESVGNLGGHVFHAVNSQIDAALQQGPSHDRGAGTGALIFVIRTWGGYPDAVAFAVLLMNMAAPTIDYYTQPRVFGEQRAQEDEH